MDTHQEAAHTAPEKLREHQFVLGLLAGLARRGVTHIIPPELDRDNKTDAAAVATFNYIDNGEHAERFAEIFDLRFYMTCGVYGDCSTWRSEIHECASFRVVIPDLRRDRLELIADALMEIAPDLPGTTEIWDELTEVFMRELGYSS